ncbi:MAG: ACP S-malonyltransferase, partial [Rhodobacteraceae bacterium]|nr:ACP S-malonyltransferase [Paracoccaceae bacterium]
VNKAMEALKEEGAKRALPLPVSVPSHSSLMKPAADELAEYLKTVTINTPKIQVIHNVDAKSHDEPDAIREALVKQLYNPVQWTHTIQIITDGADVVVECGPGKVLGGLTRRINKEVKSFSLDTPASMEKFLDSMSLED